MPLGPTARAHPAEPDLMLSCSSARALADCLRPLGSGLGLPSTEQRPATRPGGATQQPVTFVFRCPWFPSWFFIHTEFRITNGCQVRFPLTHVATLLGSAPTLDVFCPEQEEQPFFLLVTTPLTVLRSPMPSCHLHLSSNLCTPSSTSPPLWFFSGVYT